MKMDVGAERTGSSSKKQKIGERNGSQSSFYELEHRNVNQTQQHLRPEGSPGMTMQEAQLFTAPRGIRDLSRGNSPRNRHVADAGHYRETGSRQSRGSRAGSAMSKQSRNSNQYGH